MIYIYIQYKLVYKPCFNIIQTLRWS